jgi:hypothetical protein
LILRIVAKLTGEDFNMREMQVELAKAQAAHQGRGGRKAAQ